MLNRLAWITYPVYSLYPLAIRYLATVQVCAQTNATNVSLCFNADRHRISHCQLQFLGVADLGFVIVCFSNYVNFKIKSLFFTPCLHLRNLLANLGNWDEVRVDFFLLDSAGRNISDLTKPALNWCFKWDKRINRQQKHETGSIYAALLSRFALWPSWLGSLDNGC